MKEMLNAEATGGRRTRFLKPLAWLLALVVILYGGWRAAHLVRQRGAAREMITEPGPPEVAVRTVETATLSDRAWVTGEVRALQSVEIASKIPGRLERLRLPDGTAIDEGVGVETGQVVAVIEHKQQAAALSAAEAALQAAGAVRALAEVDAAHARREQERWLELRRGGSGTQLQLDQAVTAHERAKAQSNQAEAQVAQAEAALAQARANLADAEIRAPFSGLVLRKHVDEGAFVGPATPLFRLADISSVEIGGGIAGRHFTRLRTGETRAVVEVDAYPDEVFEGTVKRVRPELDRATRTAFVTIRVPNPERKLKPGMYARMQLILEERRDVPVLEESAVIRKDGETLVYAVEDGRIRVREVALGLTEGAMVEVVEGLRPGETVVLRGQQLLSDGMSVDPVERE